MGIMKLSPMVAASCVTALGETVAQAQQYAYQLAEGIQWEGFSAVKILVIERLLAVSKGSLSLKGYSLVRCALLIADHNRLLAIL